VRFGHEVFPNKHLDYCVDELTFRFTAITPSAVLPCEKTMFNIKGVKAHSGKAIAVATEVNAEIP
jgi:hypothetical protein